jgi:hypothetical protein
MVFGNIHIMALQQDAWFVPLITNGPLSVLGGHMMEYRVFPPSFISQIVEFLLKLVLCATVHFVGIISFAHAQRNPIS